MRGPLFPFVALLALTGCVLPPPSPVEQPDKMTLTGDRVELPTVFVKGCPYVALKVNGQGPYLFVVDTGSDGMCISPLVAQEAHIGSSRYRAAVTGASGQVENLPSVLLDRVEAVSFSLEGVGATLMSPETARLLALGLDQKFGGLLGMTALQSVLLEIDYPRRQVSVGRIGSVDLPVTEGLPYTGTMPQVTITTPSAKNATTTARLDTGAYDTFTLTDITTYPTRVGLIKQDAFSVGIGGYWRPLFGQLAGKIHLGPATWLDPKIYEGTANRIGSQSLAPWKLIIDPEKKMLWLLNGKLTSTTTWTGPIDPDGRPAVYGYGRMPDGDGFIIREVDSGSRAERAGLKVGDRCWNERPEPPAAAKEPAPDRLRLRVVRGAETFEVFMSLKDLPPATTKAAGSPP